MSLNWALESRREFPPSPTFCGGSLGSKRDLELPASCPLPVADWGAGVGWFLLGSGKHGHPYVSHSSVELLLQVPADALYCIVFSSWTWMTPLNC